VLVSQPDNTTPPASGQEPDGHLGELVTAVAIALLLRHAAQALHLEHAAGRRATTPIRTAAVGVSRWASAQWIRTTGGLDQSVDPIQWLRLQPTLIQRLREAKPDPAPTLPLDVEKAYRLGARQATTALGLPHPRPVEPPTLPLPDLGKAIDRRWDTAERLLTVRPVQTWEDVAVALAPIHGAVADVDRDVRTAINTAVNLAAHDAAVEHGAELLWFAEPDACVVCLALAGSVVGADEDFDETATFGRHPTPWHRSSGEPLRPPRHPRCRCRCEPWLGHAAGGGVTTLPMALKREAQRSIALGWALDSEPDSVRRDAANRLLARGANLPKSVKWRARHQVDHAKTFKRPVPTGDG
jgi:hypothetical protein